MWHFSLALVLAWLCLTSPPSLPIPLNLCLSDQSHVPLSIHLLWKSDKDWHLNPLPYPSQIMLSPIILVFSQDKLMVRDGWDLSGRWMSKPKGRWVFRLHLLSPVIPCNTSILQSDFTYIGALLRPHRGEGRDVIGRTMDTYGSLSRTLSVVLYVCPISGNQKAYSCETVLSGNRVSHAVCFRAVHNTGNISTAVDVSSSKANVVRYFTSQSYKDAFVLCIATLRQMSCTREWNFNFCSLISFHCWIRHSTGWK